MTLLQNIILVLLLMQCASVSAFAQTPYKATPEHYKIHYSERRLQTLDGATLNMWVYPAANMTKGTSTTVIVLVQGDAGNMGDVIFYAHALQQRGHTVVCFDYRGKGKSSPFVCPEKNLYCDEFALDVSSVLDTVRREYPSANVGILAFSMGSIVSILALERQRIDFLIADCLVENIPLFAKRFYRNIKPLRLEYPASAVNVPKLLQQATIPMLLFVASKDKRRPIEDALRVMEQGKNRTMILYQGEHLEGAFVMEALYFEYIATFLHQVH